MDWYFAVLRKYAVFSGRAGRMEYWMFSLFSVVISLVLMIFDGFLGFSDWGLLSFVYNVAITIPATAVSVRRLHDTGRSGWWLLANLTIVGVIPVLIFTLQQSQEGDNQYGPKPV